MTTKSVRREFNREYKNLIELHRRIFDNTNQYPKNICVDWFMNGMDNLIYEECYSKLLTEEHMVSIINMGRQLRKSEYLNNDSKKDLTVMMQHMINSKQLTISL